jgi:hypothetical protein
MEFTNIQKVINMKVNEKTVKSMDMVFLLRKMAQYTRVIFIMVKPQDMAL